MNLCRFERMQGSAGVGLVAEDKVLDLREAGIESLSDILDADSPADTLRSLLGRTLPPRCLTETKLLPPIDRQEVWASGVTYLRSKQARMEESDFSSSAYDKVYEAARPELFFKATADRVVGPGDAVGMRRDSNWNVPEPELVLVMNSRCEVVGYTIGNDMSSRDIEGENLLYLPQAKIYDRSCSLGPYITLGVSEEEVRTWTIKLCIERGGAAAFEGGVMVGQIKRPFCELAQYLGRSQTFRHGVFLFTGTGVVPPDGFTLQPGDCIRIEVSGIGALENSVIRV
ncbi:MAG TPA: fumarylacetoacetate hydrolase family protein [Opitutaceae bacterium]|jgi:2-dehydro-3-deoxy-D-arabinonate dehydratase